MGQHGTTKLALYGLAYVPYGFTFGANFTIIDTLGGRVVNFDGPGDFADASSVNPAVDFSTIELNDGGELNFARFMLSPDPIPEPATITLFTISILGFAAIRRNNRKAV